MGIIKETRKDLKKCWRGADSDARLFVSLLMFLFGPLIFLLVVLGVGAVVQGSINTYIKLRNNSTRVYTIKIDGKCIPKVMEGKK